MAFGINEISKLTSGARAMADSFSKAVGQTTRLGGAANAVSEQIGTTTESFSDFASKATEAGGVTEMVTGALKKLGPEGEAVDVVLELLVAVMTAVITTMWDLVKAAVTISQEKVAMASAFEALAVGADKAKVDGMALVDSVSALASTLPQAEGRVLAWAKTMMAAGIQGQAMERAVRSIAAAEALMGREGAAAAETLIKRLAMTAEIGGKLKLDRRLLTQMAAAGVSAAALAEQLGIPAEKLSTMTVDASKLGDAFQKAIAAKGGDALANMSNTWTSIMDKLHDGWEDLFEDMGDVVQPLMTEIRFLFAEFFAGSSTMTVAKSIITGVLKTIIEWATRAIHAIHTGFLYLQIGALKVAIAIAPVINGLRRMYANAEVLRGIKMILLYLVAPLAIIAAAIITIGTVFAVIVSIFIVGIASIVAGIAWVIGKLTSLVSSAVEAGANFVSGLVAGITGGVTSVVNAVKGLASAAVGAFGVAIDAHSPSRLMYRYGLYMPQGAAMGIEAGTPQVKAASAAMGLGAASAAGGAMGSGGGRGTISVTFSEGAIVIDGAGKSAEGITEELITLVFERLAGTQGLATP